MQIGGFEKQSLSDWSGKLAAVIFTRGCNLRCFFCHNPTLVLPDLFPRDGMLEESRILDFLKTRSGFLDGVVITGGEPTLQPDIHEFLRKLKLLGYAVKLDTNGTNPAVVERAISEKLIDCVAMDIKNVLEFTAYKAISSNLTRSMFDAICRTVELLKNAKDSGLIDVEFRTTVVPIIHKSAELDILKRDFKNIVFQKYRDEFPTIESELKKAKLS